MIFLVLLKTRINICQAFVQIETASSCPPPPKKKPLRNQEKAVGRNPSLKCQQWLGFVISLWLSYISQT